MKFSYDMSKSKYLFSVLFLAVFACLFVTSCSGSGADEPDKPEVPDKPAPETPLDEAQLRKDVAQMLIVGFRGAHLSTDNYIYRDITEYGIGGVILFEYKGNIESKEQLAQLCNDLQVAGNHQLLISIDQEGGKVARLNTKYGYPNFPSAEFLGMNDDATTTYWANETATALMNGGINLNFAPVVDVNVNSDSPGLGRIGRSFSPNPSVVSQKSSIWIARHTAMGVLSCAKHFPGHGSATTDSHNGFTDVSDTWQEYELDPYRYLIANNQLDLVMVSHVFNKNIDDKYPSSLSEKVITGLLRGKLNYKGAVITDDLGMGALVNNYTYDQILELSINAGVDLLCVSNGYDNADIVPQTINIVINKIKEGKIKAERVHEAALRVKVLKAKVNIK